MRIFPCYLKSTVIPTIIILGMFLVSYIAHLLFGEEYKSEWLTDSAVWQMEFIFVAGWCSLMCVLTAPLLLNSFTYVSDNFILSLITWFLLPFCFFTWLFIDRIKFLLHYPEDYSTEGLTFLGLALPYLVCLIWSYIKFRRALSGK